MSAYEHGSIFVRIMETIETKRYILRAFTMQDWPDVQELAIDWSKAPGPAFDKLPTKDEEVKQLMEYFAKEDRYFAVYLREAKKVIGLLALNGIDENQQLDLGHIFLSKYQDNDHDREALGAMIDYIFEKKGVLSIVTRNAPDHEAQLAPLKALGFVNLNENEKGELVIAKSEWERVKKTHISGPR